MRTLARWISNGYSMFVGGILWVLGMGGVYHCLECPICGMEVEDDEHAVARHEAFFHPEDME